MSNERTYDQFTHRHFNLIGGSCVPTTGTNTSVTALPYSSFAVPFPAKVTAAYVYALVGATGTAAAGTFGMELQKSVAGTGSWTSIATVSLLATLATGITTAFTWPSTNPTVAAGDGLRLAMSIGTAGRSSDAFNFSVAFEELPN